MSKVDTQIATELYFNKKAVYARIENEIEREEELMECMFQATLAITRWAIDFDGYSSKRERLDALLKYEQISHLVHRAMVLVMHLDKRSDLIASLAGQLAGTIKGMPDHEAGVITAGEILTLMCDYDCFDMDYSSRVIEDEETGVEYTTHSWFVRNPWELSEATSNHIKHGMYLPPMITKPMPLQSNSDSPYLTIESESLILGKGNHHNEDICLESLDRFNAIPLSINTEYLKSVGVVMKGETMNMGEKVKQQYEKFMEDSMFVYAYLYKNGNEFYLSHKMDKRGRTYAQGYHCSTQGSAFRKGAIDLANKEKVNGSFY